MDSEGERALARLKSISDEIVQLKKNKGYFPINDQIIEALQHERNDLLRRYIRDASSYP